ncbi:hypothetical protein [Mesorhizobium sp. M0601]|uniref:hypothetical protein n=1 Tax=Mesorhizobium sp. M0601 TaxID=2956969 RepID=UPI003335684F
MVIAHGLRRWYEWRGELRQEGQRVSRHYYDLHCLLRSSTAPFPLSIPTILRTLSAETRQRPDPHL